jgi:hypothetical protein
MKEIDMKLSRVKIESTVELPAGVKLAKRPTTKVQPVEGFEFLTEIGLGDSFKVTGVTARGLRNIIHKAHIRQGMRFVSETGTTRNGQTYARVWRVK